MVFNHTGHKELWDWLAQNPDKHKCDWPGWVYNGGEHIATGGCFACEYVYSHGIGDCENCPLVWPNDVRCDDITPYGSSLYYKWDDEKDLKKRSELARQIRDLPVRKGVECI